MHARTEEENVRMWHVEKATRHTKRLLDERMEQGTYKYIGIPFDMWKASRVKRALFWVKMKVLGLLEKIKKDNE